MFSSSWYPLKLYLRTLPHSIMLGLSVLFWLIGLLWLWWNIGPQEDMLFLHYTVLFGIDATGPWYQVFFGPVLGLCVFICNSIFSWYFFDKELLMSYLFNVVNLLVQLSLCIVAFLLVFLNT